MNFIKLFIHGNNFFPKRKTNIIFITLKQKKVYGNFHQKFNLYQINIMKKKNKLKKKKKKKISKNLYQKNFFNKFLMTLNSIGNKRKRRFKRVRVLISKLLMKKEMKNIIYGMIKKQKMKLYLKERLLRVDVILSQIVAIHSLTHMKNLNFIFVFTLQEEIVIKEINVNFTIMYLHQKNA